jgi:hypothetical protein
VYVLALRFGPVKSEAAAPDDEHLVLGGAIWLTASATPEFGTSMARSTFSVSYHLLTTPDRRRRCSGGRR